MRGVFLGEFMVHLRSGLAALVFAALSVLPAHAAVVFSNLGAGDSYNGGVGASIDASQAAGFLFTPTSSGFLSLIEAGMGTLQGDTVINLTLFSNVGGQPGAVLETLSATVTNPFGSCCALTLFTASGATFLDAAMQYWLIASSPSGANAPWNYSSTFGPIAFGPGLAGPWTINQNAEVEAARISIADANVVPLPAALPMFLAALGGFGALRRWRKAA